MCIRDREQAAQVDDPFDNAAGGVDDDDLVGDIDVGPDLPVDPLQFVEQLPPALLSTVGVESKDDLVKNKFGEYGEMQKGWTAEDAKGFIKVTSTALRAYYSNHKDEKI